ncbi:hypothetical protein LshimejAT787_0207110 [Lyophyllum shimeji]|uniref:Uncharacterized protein n=1 Tax=Lyophyllum shimeji TaxID=47721 RepID=A0A9P3PGN3_LYOSH|nr:hypothetical protein LshimejAT787_0207110 [Lyophyllum shimeji]
MSELPTSAGIRALNLLKWDLALGFGSSILATLWFASNLKQIIALFAWNVIATPVLGPGAALTGAALWREASLQGVASVAKSKNTLGIVAEGREGQIITGVRS